MSFRLSIDLLFLSKSFEDRHFRNFRISCAALSAIRSRTGE